MPDPNKTLAALDRLTQRVAVYRKLKTYLSLLVDDAFATDFLNVGISKEAAMSVLESLEEACAVLDSGRAMLVSPSDDAGQSPLHPELAALLGVVRGTPKVGTTLSSKQQAKRGPGRPKKNASVVPPAPQETTTSASSKMAVRRTPRAPRKPRAVPDAQTAQ